MFPAVDTLLLDTFPDSVRGSAYAVFSSAWMLMQSLGSFALGVFIESGYAYDSVFQVSAVFLGATVVALALLDRAGRLPS
jgi:MFS family permease